MKKVQTKRSGIGHVKPKDLEKPFDFCCDINHQDPETQYDMRIPPIVTSLTNVVPNPAGPDLKFRIQDIDKTLHPISVLRSGTHKVKSSSAKNYGKCKHCRGPLRWYIEDEVALARDIIAREKEIKYKEEQKARKARKRVKTKKPNKKEQIIINDAKENDEEIEDSDVEEEDPK